MKQHTEDNRAFALHRLLDFACQPRLNHSKHLARILRACTRADVDMSVCTHKRTFLCEEVPAAFGVARRAQFVRFTLLHNTRN